MAQITVKNAANVDTPVELPNANGRGAATASRPVVLATEDLAALTALATKLDTLITSAQDTVTASPISAASLPLPAGAATAAKQPALGTGAAPSADIISVQRADYRPASGNITAADAGSTTLASIASTVMHVGTPTANSTYSVAINGHSSGRLLVTGTFVATMMVQLSYDGGTTWSTAPVTFQDSTPNGAITFVNRALLIFECGGATNVRVRCSAFTSGTAVCQFVLTNNAAHPNRVLMATQDGSGYLQAVTSGGSGSVLTKEAFQANWDIALETVVLTAGAATTYPTKDMSPNFYRTAGFKNFHINIVGDQASAANGVVVEAAWDGTFTGQTNWRPVWVGSLVANVPLRIELPICFQNYRLKFTNGGVAQTNGSFFIAYARTT